MLAAGEPAPAASLLEHGLSRASTRGQDNSSRLRFAGSQGGSCHASRKCVCVVRVPGSGNGATARDAVSAPQEGGSRQLVCQRAPAAGPGRAAAPGCAAAASPTAAAPGPRWHQIAVPRPEGPGAAIVTTGQWLRYWLASRVNSALFPPSAATSRMSASTWNQASAQSRSTAAAHRRCPGHAHHHHPHQRPSGKYQLTPATLARIRATLRAALNAGPSEPGTSPSTRPASQSSRPPGGPAAVIWTDARIRDWEQTSSGPPGAVWTPRPDRRLPQRHPAATGCTPPTTCSHCADCAAARPPACAGPDVDLHHPVSRLICQQLQQYDGRLVLTAPKTAGSQRVVALDTTAVSALRRHRAAQHAERQAASRSYRDSRYVFTTQRRPGRPGPALPPLPAAVRGSRAPALPAARPPSRRRHPRPGRRRRPTTLYKTARPLQHRPDRRHLHLGPAPDVARRQPRRHRPARHRRRPPRPRQHHPPQEAPGGPPPSSPAMAIPRPPAGHTTPAAAPRRQRISPGQTGWGGWGSNPRPADYESS